MSRVAACILLGLVITVTVACSSSSTASGGHPSTSSSHSPATAGQVGQGSKPLQDYSAVQILQKVKAAMASLSSVRISGRTSGVLFDTFLKPPCEFAGTFQRGGVAVHIIRLGNTVYLRADAAFFRKIGLAAQRLAGRWVKTTADNAAFSGYVPSRVAGCFHDFLKLWAALPTQGARKAGERTVQGQQAIELLDPQNDAAYVAATGRPYLLALAFQGGDYVNFSSFNAQMAVAAPSNPIPF
jgi:hypothetical protein